MFCPYNYYPGARAKCIGAHTIKYKYTIIIRGFLLRTTEQTLRIGPAFPRRRSTPTPAYRSSRLHFLVRVQMPKVRAARLESALPEPVVTVYAHICHPAAVSEHRFFTRRCSAAAVRTGTHNHCPTTAIVRSALIRVRACAHRTACARYTSPAASVTWTQCACWWQRVQVRSSKQMRASPPSPSRRSTATQRS